MNTEPKTTKTVKKLIWPNDVREEMIKKSEFYYESERVYQYGYYDGFQKAIDGLEILPSELLKQNKEMREVLEMALNRLKNTTEYEVVDFYKEDCEKIKSLLQSIKQKK